MTDMPFDPFDAQDYLRITGEVIRELVIEQLAVENAALEQAIESMLVDAEGRGVIVVIDEPQRQRFYGLSTRVPWGRIYEFTSVESYVRWADLGYPT